MKALEVVVRVLLFFVHVAIVAIIANMIGNELSKPINILLVLAGGVVISSLIASMLFHFLNLIENLKKLTR